ncbi:MAG: protein kinase [Myxococcales bacterium]|nr:protein kinase [Myxococcales bacterium]
MQIDLESVERARQASTQGSRPRTVPDASSYLEFTEYCRDAGIHPVINPGLDRDAPPLRAEHRYSLGTRLGAGGWGQVHLAVDRNLRRSVALKTLAPEHRMSPVHVQAFIEEAIITGGLDHPNIVSAYDLAIRPGEGLFYTMKRLTGQTLYNVLAMLRLEDPEYVQHFSLLRLLGFFVEICRAIGHAHARGVLHTDLKPENIFIGEYGEVTVVDWGLAQVLGPGGRQQARARIRAGTPEYMAPEQFQKAGRDLDPRADIWALGLILYELLTLQLPFTGKDMAEIRVAVLHDPVTPPRVMAPRRAIPMAIEKVCMRALEKDPARRFASVSEMLWAVDDFLQGVRERARRHEIATAAIAQADEQLAELRAIERELDSLQAILREASGEDSPEDARAREALEGLRRQSLPIYQRAADVLIEALDAEGAEEPLHDAIGDLYWRVFSRVYPGVIRPSKSISEGGGALLHGLGERALAAIVRAGEALAKKRGLEVEARNEGPWRAIVRSLGGAERGADGKPSAITRLVTRITFLRAARLFRDIEDQDLLPVAEVCEARRYEPGDMIFTQGASGDAMCVIVDGTVEILRDGELINTQGPRSCFGEIAVLGATTRTASVRAKTRVVCLLLEAGRFREIALGNGVIAMALVDILNQRLRVATEREAALRASSERPSLTPPEL